MTIEDVLAAGSGLLDGRMRAEAFRATLTKNAVAGESDAAGTAKQFIDALGNEPGSTTAADVDSEPIQDAPATMDDTETMPLGEAASSFDLPAEDAPVAPVAADGRERCPHCGRPMPKHRVREPRKPRPSRAPGTLIPHHIRARRKRS